MKVETEQIPYVVVVTARGNPSDGSPDEISETVGRLLDEGNRRIILDISGLAKIDSETIGALVASYVDLTKREARVSLVLPKLLYQEFCEGPEPPGLLLESMNTVDSREKAIDQLALYSPERQTALAAKRRASIALKISLLALVLFVILLLVVVLG